LHGESVAVDKEFERLTNKINSRCSITPIFINIAMVENQQQDDDSQLTHNFHFTKPIDL